MSTDDELPSQEQANVAKVRQDVENQVKYQISLFDKYNLIKAGFYIHLFHYLIFLLLNKIFQSYGS